MNTETRSLGLIIFFVFSISCVLLLFESTIRAPSQPHVKPSKDRNYRLVSHHAGKTFFDEFNFEAIADPTHGHVSYKSREEAVALNLTYVSDDGYAYIHSDHKRLAPQGRDSVRISTKRHYTRGLYVLDLAHMPVGCGTWPAFWSTAVEDWPNLGEIDIIEGVNSEIDNAMTLHTGKGCRQPQFREMVGTTESPNCDIHAHLQFPNQGCTVKTKNSFGEKLNVRGGAVIAMQWTSTSIKIWMFERNEIPGDIESDSPEPARWRIPDSSFLDDHCDIAHIFRKHVIIINNTFCGDWAGNTYVTARCPGLSCVDFVSNNPAAFESAYWKIKSLKVFQSSTD